MRADPMVVLRYEWYFAQVTANPSLVQPRINLLAPCENSWRLCPSHGELGGEPFVLAVRISELGLLHARLSLDTPCKNRPS